MSNNPLRKIGGVRTDGEDPEVSFDKDVHPGIVFRSLLLQIPPDKIAAAIGIDLHRLSVWMEAYPEMQQAKLESEQADATVVQSLFDLATGWTHPQTHKVAAPNVAAIIFWLKARMRWSDQPPPPQPQLKPSEMTGDQLQKLGTDLLRAIDSRDTIDVTPKKEEKDEDAGF